MANVKITELTAATALAGTDVLPIVDVGADATKKVSVSDLLRNLPDGTASAPALAFADDQNTGLLSPGDNSLAFATSGTQRLVIDSSGNVGIGDTSPSNKLVVKDGGSPTIEINGQGRAASLTLGVTASESKLFEGSNNALAFGTNNAERMRITQGGNVGVGTTSPDRKLHVRTDNAAAAKFGGEVGGDYAIEIGQLSAGSAPGFNATGGQSMLFQMSGTEAMRINSSGNLGIGTTSPQTITHVFGADPILRIQDSSTSIADGFAAIQLAESGAGGSLNNYWQIALEGDSGTSTDHLTFKDGTGERMRIDSSGRVAIGTTTINTNSMLSVHKGDSSESQARFTNTTTGAGGNNGFIVGIDNNEHARLFNMENGPMRFGTNNTERMRIASDGTIRLGNFDSSIATSENTNSGFTLSDETFAIARSSVFAKAYFSQIGDVSGEMIRFSRNGADVGSIDVAGSSTSYNTSSDYRLKENVTPVTDGITRVKQLQPKRFNFIADNTTTVHGFLAHEAQAVVPEAVTGTHNEVDDDNNPVYQGIDQSKLVPLLTAALQEAIAKIETLETKVAALEAQ